MPRYLALKLTALMTLFVAFPSYAANDNDDGLDEIQTKLGTEWVLIKNDQLRQIKTYVKQEDGKRFRSFKVDAVLDSTLETAVRVILDVENYKKWYWEILESHIIRANSPTEYYIYLKHRAPYGVPNRDVAGVLLFEPQSKGKNFITMRVKAIKDLVPEKPPLVRMVAEDMTLIYTPLPNNKLHVQAEGYVDPGGRVPGWANNYIQRSAPYSIMLGILRMTEHEKYRNSKEPLPFPINNSPD
ncbi:MAG: hypothetical protein Q7S87_19560 [Agitococcus sp.]|nr:hypothetical protein [Agitococcus sp.]